MEAPTPTPAAMIGAPKKRPLEQSRPEFVAREAGAYHVLEMPKRPRCGYTAATAGPCRRHARSHFLMRSNAAEEKKRALELDKPEFVAEEGGGGAYDISEMPKKYKFQNMADPERSSSPLENAYDAHHARSLARVFRSLSVSRKYTQELKAMAAARHN
ncbi:unnamed protein product [Urochloa decumbens]|uniref:Uncharacterized protein n=1 Tax=Urochloa decumbens TaxID=240449 RepID=A0ABC9H4B9_9POAL